MFGVFDPDQSGDITKAEFMMNIQGMEMTLSLEDILELFNFMDDKSINRITRTQFVDSMTFL
jgi:Ca2+-binding EF-hand superfamily protein